MNPMILRDLLTETLEVLGAPPECMPDHRKTEAAA